MKLKVLGSNSAGNCYILQGESESLIIEAGVKFTDIKKGLDFNLMNVAGCIVTHEHGDHAKYAREIAAAGIKIYATKGTIEHAKLEGNHNAVPVKLLSRKEVGGFTLLPFPVEHDASDPCGFLISHQECGKILFLTDSSEIDYEFKGLNNIIIEANYGCAIAEQRIMQGKLDARHQERVNKSHLSIEKCLTFLNRTDLSQCNHIVLIHLSDGSSNAAEFKNAVVQATGKTTTIADKGVTIDNFNKKPF